MNDIDIFLEKANMHSITDVVEKLNRFMCHIGQEPHLFGTYGNWKDIDQSQKNYSYFVRKIKTITPNDYIHFFVTGEGISPELQKEGRVASACKHMSEVAARLVSRIKKIDTYVIGCVLPKYARGREPRKYEHFLNAIVEKNTIRYFDSSVYLRIFREEVGKWDFPDDSFNRADIDFDRYIDWEFYLQKSAPIKGAGQRKIELDIDSAKIIDNYARLDLKSYFYYSRVEGKNKPYIY